MESKNDIYNVGQDIERERENQERELTTKKRE